MGLVTIDWKTAAVLALFSAGVVYVAKRAVTVGAEKIVEELTEKDGALNPTNPDNVANSLFDDMWQGVTGSDESFGADVYDLFENGTIY